MTLQAKLDEMKRNFEATAPPEALTVMHGATRSLLQSGIMNSVLRAGVHAPGFALTDHNGKEVNSADLLAKGPLVVGFYRGIW